MQKIAGFGKPDSLNIGSGRSSGGLLEQLLKIAGAAMAHLRKLINGQMRIIMLIDITECGREKWKNFVACISQGVLREAVAELGHQGHGQPFYGNVVIYSLVPEHR